MPVIRVWVAKTSLVILSVLLIASGSVANSAANSTPGGSTGRGPTAYPPPTPKAHAARTLKAVDVSRLHYIKSSGSLIYEEGTAQGTLPGSMRAHCNIGALVTAVFTIYTRQGNIKGRGTARPHGSGIYESFAGTLVVTGGTGRYAHAHGHAGLYGTFNRRTYALTLQTTGALSY